MKIFLKWTFNGFLLLSAIVLLTVLKGEFDKSKLGVSIIAVLIGSVILGLLFYLLQVQYIPWRKKKLTKKIIRIFDSQPISETMTHFKLGAIDFYTTIEFNLRMSQYTGNAEIINFHIPRQQIDRLPHKPKFKLQEDNCNGIETYKIYQTNGLGLKLAKRRFEKRTGN